MSKARRDSTVSELEERLKDVTTANQKFRKQLHEKDSELQVRDVRTRGLSSPLSTVSILFFLVDVFKKTWG
jgi:hypothetical protein